MTQNPLETEHAARFVQWFRQMAPYVHEFRGKTFVVGFGGELIEDGVLNALIQDLSLLSALGIHLVLVHGSRPQVNEQLAIKGHALSFDHDMAPTTAAALECAKEAAGEIRLDIEAAFSQGLPNTPMSHAQIRIVSGNVVTARPIGIVDGTDYQHSGTVRKIDTAFMRSMMDQNAIVLLSPLGFSPTGEAFNLAMEDLACQAAIALQADKLIFLTPDTIVGQSTSGMEPELARREADQLLADGTLDPAARAFVRHASLAVRRGVARAHLVPYRLDGSIFLELFTHEGVGAMIVEDTLDDLRAATVDDIGAIVQLIEPLEQDGTLVPRGRASVERDIKEFTVLEHDGIIYGSVALKPYPKATMGELACLVVHPAWQGSGEGETLLHHTEARARQLGLTRLFVLTTRTSHWFIKRGFVQGGVKDLPPERQAHYNHSRNSLIFIKKL